MTQDALQPPTTTYPLFVYGTLKRGEANYAPYLAGRTHDEQPGTLTGAAIFTDGLVPYLVLEDDLVTPNDEVSGLVFTIEPLHFAETMKQIDRLEEYIPGDPRSEYQRVLQTIETATGPIQAWTYIAGLQVLADIRAGLLQRITGSVWRGGLQGAR